MNTLGYNKNIFLNSTYQRLEFSEWVGFSEFSEQLFTLFSPASEVSRLGETRHLGCGDIKSTCDIKPQL